MTDLLKKKNVFFFLCATSVCMWVTRFIDGPDFLQSSKKRHFFSKKKRNLWVYIFFFVEEKFRTVGGVRACSETTKLR